MGQKIITRLAIYGLLCAGILLIVLHRKEGFVELAPATYLEWDGGEWCLCDNGNRTRGIESVPGGNVIVDHVAALQVVGKSFILAVDTSGKRFVIKVDEWKDDEVRSFATEAEWLEAAKAAGIVEPRLADPADFYK